MRELITIAHTRTGLAPNGTIGARRTIMGFRFAMRTLPVPAFRIGPAILLLLIVAGCHDGIGPWARRHTYAPPFNYVPRSELRSAMWTLGESSAELDRLLREASKTGHYPREQIARLLAEMDEAAQRLGPGEWPSNHPEIGGGVEPLRDDIRRARLALERDPPNYFLAGSVTGACLYCHRP